MRSAAQRINAFEARMTSSQIDPVLAAMQTQATDNYAAYAVDWVAKQQAVHDYLDGEGVYPAEYFNYSAFAGEIYHVEQHFSGAAAINAASDLVLKWKGCGCTEVRLKAICSNVFNIVVP